MTAFKYMTYYLQAPFEVRGIKKNGNKDKQKDFKITS